MASSEGYSNLKHIFDRCSDVNTYDVTIIRKAKNEFYNYWSKLDSNDKNRDKLNKIIRAVEALEKKDNKTFKHSWSDAEQLFREHICIDDKTENDQYPVLKISNDSVKTSCALYNESDITKHRPDGDYLRPRRISSLTEEKQRTESNECNAEKNFKGVPVPQNPERNMPEDLDNIPKALYSFKDSDCWMNAYEEVEELVKAPQRAVNVCLYIFYEAFRFCEEQLSKKLVAMIDAMFQVLNLQQASIAADPHYNLLLREYVQMHATLAVKKLHQDFLHSRCQHVLDKLRVKGNIGPCLEAYAKMSVQLAWFAVIVDKPLELEIANRGTHFDENKYTPYTCAGTDIYYVVWPVVKCKDGTILHKGVAEGK